MSDSEDDDKKDSRIVCKYGVKCYQKNSAHHKKYKHPPEKNRTAASPQHTVKKQKVEVAKNKVNEIVTKNDVSDSEDYSIDDDSDRNSDKADTKRTIAPNNDVSDSDLSDNETNAELDKQVNLIEAENKRYADNLSKISVEDDKHKTTSTENEDKSKLTDLESKIQELPGEANFQEIIKDKFLVDMPKDFYQFWEFCQKLKPTNPLETFKDVGLRLVGPFDVLAGKFTSVSKSNEEYLIHWRYYRDPPEFQTVLKGDDKIGYHIGYFRDSPDELPVFLCSNCAKKDGVLIQMGGNIFAALNFYLEDLKKTGDPFKKMYIGKFVSALKNEAEVLKIDLSRKTTDMINREKKIVTRTFNKIGLVVPLDKKTEVGYRDLALNNKDLNILLTKLQSCDPHQRIKYLSELQPVFTFASIAVDECDFGTGIELGWNIISHGVDCLNSTAQQFLASSYRLLNREAFAKIAEAHMKNRKTGCDLSII